MTTVYEKNGRFFVGAPARLVTDDKLTAWVEHHVRQDPDIKWIIGNYIEAERANENGYIFPLESMANAKTGIKDKPFNMLHQAQYVIGAYAGAELVDANGDTLNAEEDEEHETVVVEALAAMWHNHFPEEYAAIEQAHQQGAFFYSMECTPESVTCPECDMTAAFDGKESETYCEHMNGVIEPKRLDNPQFHGGAAIIPPVRPGWKGAHAKELMSLLDKTDDVELDVIYSSLKYDFSHLEPADWESMMAQIISLGEAA